MNLAVSYTSYTTYSATAYEFIFCNMSNIQLRYSIFRSDFIHLTGSLSFDKNLNVIYDAQFVTNVVQYLNCIPCRDLLQQKVHLCQQNHGEVGKRDWRKKGRERGEKGEEEKRRVRRRKEEAEEEKREREREKEERGDENEMAGLVQNAFKFCRKALQKLNSCLSQFTYTWKANPNSIKSWFICGEAKSFFSCFVSILKYYGCGLPLY